MIMPFVNHLIFLKDRPLKSKLTKDVFLMDTHIQGN